ncbi:MAG: glycyl-radical enzyme activating protein [Ruminococcaceae bacterium]|nr:glycyl-radical enzyme activating protein [Oscillospiraceae bacterium]
MSQSKGFVFDIYRGTTHDGPGMRTTVFFKGCPLNCLWCHNPESISIKNQIWWDKTQCIGCMECAKTCKNISFDKKGFLKDENCRFCGKCVEACPAKALSFIGKYQDVQTLLKEVKKYEVYYKTYGGGVTVSGGEPLLQSDFVKEFFEKCKENKIHTALDTCGAVPFECFEKVLPFTDCILYDLKLMDSQLHKKYTGQGNEKILDNLLKISYLIKNKKINAELWIRTPLIKDITATKENISAEFEFLKENLLDTVSRIEFCTFNKACVNKYEKLGVEWSLSHYPLIGSTEIEEIRKIALNKGIDDEKIVISGITTQ